MHVTSVRLLSLDILKIFIVKNVCEVVILDACGLIKSLRKKKRKGVQKKKLIETGCESNIKTVVDKASELINYWAELYVDEFKTEIEVSEDSDSIAMTVITKLSILFLMMNF